MGTEEQRQDWLFTFGHGHEVMVRTDANGMYVAINGTFDEARAAMFAKFGRAWSWQYGSVEELQPGRFGMRQIPLADIAAVPTAQASADRAALTDAAALLRRWIERAGSDEGDEQVLDALDLIEQHIRDGA